VVTQDIALAAALPPATHEQWVLAAEAALKGKSLSSLVTHLPDGIDLQPLYGPDDVVDSGVPGAAPWTRGVRSAPLPEGAWDVRVVARHPDPAEANRVLLDDLDGGASSILVRGDLALRTAAGSSSELVGVDGVAVHGPAGLGVLLSGVHLDLAPVVMSPGASFRAAADWMRSAGVHTGGVGADPLGTLADTGVIASSWQSDLAALSAELDGSRLKALTIDVGPYAAAGATPTQQLACLLATAAAYLRATGLDARATAAQTEVVLALDADFFTGIATVRAARRLWGALLGACGVQDVALSLHVATSPRMLSRRDPWVNLLRVTSAVFAAGVAGADGVTAHPFDAVVGGTSDELARRLARNTQLLLQEESHIAAVIDPAGGSAYVEQLTEQLAQKAWDSFQDLESRGGMHRVLTDGSLAEALAGSWSARRARLATRQESVTGVTEFPLITEEPVRREVPDLVAACAQAIREASPVLELTRGSALPRHRDAEDVEALRDAADGAAAAGSRPVVLLAALGPVAAYTARVTWAKNFFEAGGFATEVQEVTAETVAAALADTGAALVCLCSSDKVYDAQAAPVAAQLGAASRVYLAGRFEAAGVHETVSVGTDLVEVLTRALQMAGVRL
jgi:methylmalonyl-CoA mutase